MPDEPKDSTDIDKIVQDSRSIEQMIREIEDEGGQELNPPKVQRGDKINVGMYRAVVSSIFSESGPDGYVVRVVFLDNDRAMKRFAKWSEGEQCWNFREGDTAQYAGPGLADLIQKLRT